MFKIGQYVRIKKNPDGIFKIQRAITEFGTPLYAIENLIGTDYEYYWERELVAVEEKTCPVCGKIVIIKENKIKEHKNDGRVCYGSYIPIKLVSLS